MSRSKGREKKDILWRCYSTWPLLVAPHIPPTVSLSRLCPGFVPNETFVKYYAHAMQSSNTNWSCYPSYCFHTTACSTRRKETYTFYYQKHRPKYTTLSIDMSVLEGGERFPWLTLFPHTYPMRSNPSGARQRNGTSLALEWSLGAFFKY